MYKKITGVADSGNLEEVKRSVRNARSAFQDSVQHFKNKRGEYMQMKADNELEREVLRKEEKMAQSFKFTTMKKKVAFLPSVH